MMSFDFLANCIKNSNRQNYMIFEFERRYSVIYAFVGLFLYLKQIINTTNLTLIESTAKPCVRYGYHSCRNIDTHLLY